MPDLDVVAVLKAKPGSEAVLKAALTGLVEPTRAEAGCLEYSLLVSTTDPSAFVTIEKWQSQQDLEAHLQTDHVKAALDAAGEHFASPPDIYPLAPLS